MKSQFKNFFVDVDGVMTKVFFGYSRFGKKIKFFSADDSDAIKILSNYINVHFLSADLRGFKITKKRIVKDMNQKLTLVPANLRLDWIKEFGDLKETIYMGDSFTDIKVMREVGFGITVQDSNKSLKRYCKFVTEAKGGERAVSEACEYILSEFFKIDF